MIGRYRLVVIVAVMAVGCAKVKGGYDYKDANAMINQAKSDPGTTFLIHESPSGCPQSWVELPSAFGEKNGTRVNGCMRAGVGYGSAVTEVDVLYPGETLL